ncbi:MAG TPA: hypothetical protein VGL99_15375 [Chloroflexota bacterium]
MKQTVFHGTEQETSYLLRAIERNCNCRRALTGQLAEMCGAHRMLLDDQRALNGLLFARRIADRLISEEQKGRPALRLAHR